MSIFFAVVCFFLAGYFVLLAFHDPYSSNPLVLKMERAKPMWMFPARIVTALALTLGGVALL